MSVSWGQLPWLYSSNDCLLTCMAPFVFLLSFFSLFFLSPCSFPSFLCFFKSVEQQVSEACCWIYLCCGRCHSLPLFSWFAEDISCSQGVLWRNQWLSLSLEDESIYENRAQKIIRLFGTCLKVFSSPQACAQVALLGNLRFCISLAVWEFRGSLCMPSYIRAHKHFTVRCVQLASLIALEPELQREILGALCFRCDRQCLVQYKVQLPMRMCAYVWASSLFSALYRYVGWQAGNGFVPAFNGNSSQLLNVSAESKCKREGVLIGRATMF